MYIFLFCFLSIISAIPLQKIWKFFSFFRKMACKNCFKDNEELFIKSVTEFKSRRFLVEFLLKIVLNIQLIWLWFCSCKKVSDRCLVCQFYAIYKEQQYKIYENLLNLDFLERFHSHTVRNLQILRKEDSILHVN